MAEVHYTDAVSFWLLSSLKKALILVNEKPVWSPLVPERILLINIVREHNALHRSKAQGQAESGA